MHKAKGSLPEGEETFGFFKEFFEFFELSPQVTEGVFPPAGDGRNCNGCNLHDASRVQELLHRLKESYVDKKNKVNSFGIIN